MEKGMRPNTISIPSTFDGISQNIACFQAKGTIRPLLVALHTWSYDYTQDISAEYFRRCAERDWNCIFPDFRGPCRTPQACGSPAALSDIQDALNWAMEHFSVDPRRIFLAGESGGGYMSLLAAGRFPTLWTAVSAWVPIFDLARWHAESIERGLEYAAELETVCEGAPGVSAEVNAQYRLRSPLDSLWRAHIIPVDINAGIHDGHGGSFGGAGSVPVGHSIRAFNELSRAAGKTGSVIPEEAITRIEKEETVPEEIENHSFVDTAYDREIHLRRENALARLTLFEGGHEIIYDAAFNWFERF